MAINRVEDALQKGYWLGFGDLEITLDCPAFMGLLIDKTLSGWRQASRPISQHDSDITVRYDGARFTINCPVIHMARDYSDVIDTLNTVFICLAYLSVNHWPDKILLHCAAYKGDATLIVFGGKKTGKSTLIAQAAVRGDTILADDLFLWDPSQTQFEALGFPLRLRRPVHANLVVCGIGEKLFAGRSLAYSKRNAFAIAPAGTTCFPDDILEAEGPGNFTPVPLFDVLASIQRYRIASRNNSEYALGNSSIF